jgi:hypothetical protein
MRIAANRGRNAMKPATAPRIMPSAVPTFANLSPFHLRNQSISGAGFFRSPLFGFLVLPIFRILADF